MTDISWKLIDKYFADNPENLVAHHLDSYNDFFSDGIFRVFKENNIIKFIERDEGTGNQRNEVSLYLGGKEGNKLHFGKPIIYDETHSHYMYPNDARLRNMTYGITIHYDVDVEYIYYDSEGLKLEHNTTLEKMYLGRFPIMLHSNLCILKSLSTEVKFNMGECRNDPGGYFIIDGKEKVIVSQEKFADNMFYIKNNKSDDLYSTTAGIRSVSEDTSKPKRTITVQILAPTSRLTNNQILVSVPNVRKPVPFFILMRALGVISDKDIIKHCLLSLEKNDNYIDLFIPSIHDASTIFTQSMALEYIASFTKRGTVSSVMEILSDYLLPHIGELNFLDKAYFLGYMVFNMLKVFTKERKPTDRDNFKFKRIDLTGTLIYDLFREYFVLQLKNITTKIDEEYYFHKGEYIGDVVSPNTGSRDKEPDKYKDNFISLISSNVKMFFKDRIVEAGLKKAFKGNWGSQANTIKIGLVQDLNRLSWNTFMSHLRKLNLPLSDTAKVIGPRLLNSSQWGLIDPLDTPDGGNIGLHKHLSISTHISSGTSAMNIIKWLISNTPLQIVLECSSDQLFYGSKMIVNGNWVGIVDNPLEVTHTLKLYRRNGLIPTYTSISFNYETNEIHIYTDAGRLSRPIYYITDKQASYDRPDVTKLFLDESITWQQIVTGFKAKQSFDFKQNKLYSFPELYPDTDISVENKDTIISNTLRENQSVVDYIDTAEEESTLIAINQETLSKSKYYTHVEIDPSLLLGVMGNQIIYPENNPLPRNSFSCGQSRQAVSVYHSNYQMRIDKMGVVLNYGQIPLVKSRYLEYINKEEQPYGINAIVAIMTYTGYNVEDAILINKGAVDRGIFRTSYFSSYESREESTNVEGTTDSKFSNIEKTEVINTKKGYDYSLLDDHGIIKENTAINDKTILIGKVKANPEDPQMWIDDSTKPKKGQVGYVDKSFITDGEEGYNIAKVRIREERIPAIGDKMASRAGQKGTLGLIVSEENMPFTTDGIRPDLIINPHALPSRMTIGQIIESLFGKVCTSYGAFGDCTAFQVNGPNYTTYAPLLVKSGFNYTGNQILYDGMNGSQMSSDIYIGPTYYMRLKHMVKDKINYRARGPNEALTKQPIGGRANDGGLRIGEMERDGVLAHGMSYFLKESFLTRGDDYFIAVCNKTGTLSIYNESANLFLSPQADGPIEFHINTDGTMNVKNISRFGRSFSILRVPYSFKLLVQELVAMNVQMRIVTDDNVDQLMSMSFSDNIVKMLKMHNFAGPEGSESNKTLRSIVEYKKYVTAKIDKSRETQVSLSTDKLKFNDVDNDDSGEYEEDLPAYDPKKHLGDESPPYRPVESQDSPAYRPVESQDSPAYRPVESQESPAYRPVESQESPAYRPVESQESPAYSPTDPIPSVEQSTTPAQYSPPFSPTDPVPAVATPMPPRSPPRKESEFIAYISPKYHIIYWINRTTGVSTWTKPDSVIQEEKDNPQTPGPTDWTRQIDYEGSGYWLNTKTGDKMWMDWAMHTNSKSKEYWFNKRTGESSWDEPQFPDNNLGYPPMSASKSGGKPPESTLTERAPQSEVKPSEFKIHIKPKESILDVQKSELDKKPNEQVSDQDEIKKIII